MPDEIRRITVAPPSSPTTFKGLSPLNGDNNSLLLFYLNIIIGSWNIRLLPLFIPVCGISTMVCTIAWSCLSRFDCSERYPTLSYAATFSPEGYVFTLGMCFTAFFIAITIIFFHRHLSLSLPLTLFYHKMLSNLVLLSGLSAAISLFLLAILDMKNFHLSHIFFTITFFITGWITITLCHITRYQLRQQPREHYIISRKCLDLGRNVLALGIICTITFSYLFLSVNGIIANPFGFTAIQEALVEFIAIVCQLIFMGTLTEELSLLNVHLE